MEKIRFARYCKTPPCCCSFSRVGFFGLDFGNVLNYMSYFHQVVLFSFWVLPQRLGLWWKNDVGNKFQNRRVHWRLKSRVYFYHLGFVESRTTKTKRGCDCSFKIKYVICICGRIGYKWNLHEMVRFSQNLFLLRGCKASIPSVDIKREPHCDTFFPLSSVYSWAAAIRSSWSAFLPFSSLSTSHS